MADLLMKMPIPYEPKRVNRFILRFDSTLGINEWFVESAARPSIKINSVPIPFLNTETYVTTVGLYNDNNELLAVAKLSRPIIKDFTKESLLRVKLDF